MFEFFLANDGSQLAIPRMLKGMLEAANALGAQGVLGLKFSLTPLYITMPILASFLVLLICLFSRKLVQRVITKGGAEFTQGLLSSFLVIVAVYSMCNYFDFGKWRLGSFFNAYEFYHYYIGSKYWEEVGYENMYFASVVADAEAEGGTPRYNNPKGTLRDLETGRHVPYKPVVEEGEKYKALFSDIRWEEFKKDIEFFKKELGTGRWGGILGDKGYNATPVWTSLVGGIFSNNVDTNNERGMTLLAMLDVMLIFTAFGFVCWAFGLRAGLLMLVLLGTSYVMKYSHMKGAYLRTDFTMSMLVSICLVKKNYYKTAGVLAGYSILSRIFPAVYLFGLGAKLAWDVAPQLKTILRARRINGPAVSALLGVWVAVWIALFTVGPWPIFTQKVDAGRNLWTVNDEPLFSVALRESTEGSIVMAPVPMFVFAAVPVGFGLLVLGLLFLRAWHNGTVSRRYLHFFLSCAATMLVLVGVSIAYTGGTAYWREYTDKIGQHNQDISPWRVGFKYLFIGYFNVGPKVKDMTTQATRLEQASMVAKLAMQQKSDKGLAATLEAKRDFFFRELKVSTRSVTYKTNSAVYWTIVGTVLLLSFFAVYGLKDHEAFAWSFVPVFFMVAPTYYYYIMLLIPLLFFSPYIDRPARAIGAIMLLLSAIPGYYLYGTMKYQQQFPTYYWHSVMFCGICLYMLLVAGGVSLRAAFRKPAIAGGPEEGTPPPLPARVDEPLPWVPAAPAVAPLPTPASENLEPLATAEIAAAEEVVIDEESASPSTSLELEPLAPSPEDEPRREQDF